MPPWDASHLSAPPLKPQSVANPSRYLLFPIRRRYLRNRGREGEEGLGEKEALGAKAKKKKGGGIRRRHRAKEEEDERDAVGRKEDDDRRRPE